MSAATCGSGFPDIATLIRATLADGPRERPRSLCSPARPLTFRVRLAPQNLAYRRPPRTRGQVRSTSRERARLPKFRPHAGAGSRSTENYRVEVNRRGTRIRALSERGICVNQRKALCTLKIGNSDHTGISLRGRTLLRPCMFLKHTSRPSRALDSNSTTNRRYL
jgi:hypothetical protein